MPNPSLAVGGYGEDVAHLHDQLAKQGYQPPASEVARRFFGPGTRSVLLKYQAERGLECTGEVDEATAAVLEQASMKPSKAPTTPRVAARRERPAKSEFPARSDALEPISAPIGTLSQGQQLTFASFQYGENIMSTLQETIRYAGNAGDAPITAIDVQFQLPIHEYYVEDSDGRSAAAGSVHKRIVATEVVSITTSISAQEYRVELGSAFIAGKDRKLFQLFIAESMKSKSVDNFSVGIDVVYFSNGQFAIGKQSLRLVFFPKFYLVTPQRTLSASADSSDSLILINKEVFSHLSKRLTTATGLFDSFALLAVISLLTDTTAAPPELIKLSADDTERLEGMLAEAGVAEPAALLDNIKTDFGALFDIPLTIPEIESVKIGGTLRVVTSDASAITKDDLLLYDLSAEYSICETGELQILHFRFGNDVIIQNNAAPFAFKTEHPILHQSIDGPISVKVTGRNEVPWSKYFKAADPHLDSIEISVPLQRGNRVVASDNAKVPAVPKKLRGQVLQLGTKCALKDLTVVLQAKTAADQPWRIVGAAKTDQAGNFNMPYPFGIFTAAQAAVSLTPNDPVAVTVTEVRPVNQTISDDFLYLLVRDADCPTESKEDCDCESPKKAGRLPDYADLETSDNRDFCRWTRRVVGWWRADFVG